MTTSRISLICIIFATYYTGCYGLEIVNLVVPPVIQNGSSSSVILDCIYSYDRQEKEGLVVKWFWNHEPEAVYQWIPGKKPEAIGILKGRVNLDYSASKDKYSQHRALEILYPTTELTGTFTCRVSSFHDEKFDSKTMIVFAPPTSMNISHHKPTSSSVNITCDAHGIFPKPTLKLYEGTSDNTRSLVSEAADTLETDEAFSIYLNAVVDDRTLRRQETIFQCVLAIPKTKYRLRREIIYVPGSFAFDGYFSAAAQNKAVYQILLTLSILIPMLYIP